jgi:SAM-dependent methyltransferase
MSERPTIDPAGGPVGKRIAINAVHEQNRRFWEEITPIHVAAGDYDVDGFLAGGLTLGREEREAVGDVAGKRLLHLQCHFGLDTLSWARLGASVVGVDFSESAIAAAADLTRRSGLAGRARFVLSDVLALESTLEEDFDIVFTSIGALCWMSDIDRWGEVVSRYVSPSGFFYVLEDHPVGLMLDVGPGGGLAPMYGYFRGREPIATEGEPDYSQPDYVPRERQLSYIWAVSAVMGALERNAMWISEFKEFPYMRWKLGSEVRQDRAGNYRLPERMAELPLMYSLKARHRRAEGLAGNPT